MGKTVRLGIYFLIITLGFFAARIHDRSTSLTKRQLTCLTAKYYGPRELSCAEINRQERAIYEKINSLRADRGLPSLKISDAAMLVARYHSNLMRRQGVGSFEFKGVSSIEQRKTNAGIGDNCFYALYGNISIRGVIKQIESEDASIYTNDELTHIGIGVIRQWLPWRYWATIVYIGRIASVKKFPVYLSHEGFTETLRWKLKESYNNPVVEITIPSGESEQLPVHSFLGGFYSAEIPFRQKGKYIVEILAKGPYGPEVAQIMPVYIGVEREDALVGSKSKPLDIHHEEDLERAMFELINKERQKYEIEPLQFNTRLCEIARVHSYAMAKAGKAVHNLPGSPDLGQRVEDAHLKVLMRGENVAFDSSIEKAHRGLMGSPAHRHLIVDPNFSDVGIAIVRRKNLLFITEDFARFIPDISPLEGKRKLLRQMREFTNAYFEENIELSSIAQEHSKKMAFSGRLLGVKGLQKEIGSHQIRYKQIYFFTISALTMEQITEKVKDKLPSLNSIKEAGVGIQQDKQGILWVTLILIF
ncbi:MAG: hypothetical protein B1H08_05045 [Candidatus Omnitrophica bacterium 4484_171]|nr:MAG: hypothetical protein B1H08_05045 [Candidatus Omnitrophica bacterium 4484_171]